MSSDPDHVDLLGLLSGELPPAQRSLTLGHIRGCEQCRSQLTETAALVGELKDAGRHSPVDPSEVPPFDRGALVTSDLVSGLVRGSTRLTDPSDDAVLEPEAPPRRLPMRRRLVVAAGAGIVAAMAGGVAIGHTLHGPGKRTVDVRLAALGQTPTPAAGAARMVGSGQSQRMEVRLTGLTLPASRDTVEVWLLNTRTGQTRAIGTMPVATGSSMTATFPLPAADLAGFDAVDVSIQSPADHGRHSDDSVLRGQVT